MKLESSGISLAKENTQVKGDNAVMMWRLLEVNVKRALDIIFSILGLIFLLPIGLAVALGITLTSVGPIIFRQKRLGRGGKLFWILKFRTMVVEHQDEDSLVTAAGNKRITNVGAWLRHTKLDEIPQLFNVLRGDMSFVGPRPEVAEFANLYPHQYERILKVRPGITHAATLKFRREEDILAATKNPSQYYVERVMPIKLAAYEAQLESSLVEDISTIVQTILPHLGEAPWGPEHFKPLPTRVSHASQSPKIGNVPVLTEEVIFKTSERNKVAHLKTSPAKIVNPEHSRVSV